MDTFVQGFAQRTAEARERFVLLRPEARRIQEELLAKRLADAADTAFGRDHGFKEIRTIADYRQRVPIRTYDEISPYVERAAGGERAVLTRDEPIAYYKTSGSTGAAKKIPATAASRATYWDAMAITYGTFIHWYPEIAERPESILTLARDHRPVEAHTASGVPWGALSNMWLPGDEGQWQPPWTNAPWASGAPVERDAWEERVYFLLRHAVAADVRCIITVNPSTLVALGRFLEEVLPRLIQELRDGTVYGQPGLPKNPQRSRELEALVGRGRVRPNDVWPNISLLVAWKSASTQLYLPQVEETFGPKAQIFSHFIAASEAILAVPVERESVAQTPHFTVVHYEFVPIEEDLRGDSPSVSMHEVEVGRTYHLVVTTASGLYRYALGDTFKVLDRVDGVPLIEFLGRKGSVSSFTGEKLTEAQIVAAVDDAAQGCGVRIADATCCPVWGDPPHYAFVVELRDVRGEVDVARLEAALEAQLGQHNAEYPSKRATRRLGPARVHVVPAGTFKRLGQLALATGTSPTQQKSKLLQKDATALATLLDLAREG